jgi:hypothetical protein
MELSLPSLLSRCEEVGECLIWQGRIANKSPQVFMVDPTAQNGGRYVQVRRAVHELTTGKPLVKGLHPSMKCRDPKCIAFGHMVLLSAKAVAQLAGKEGKLSMPSRKAAISAGIRKSTNAKLTLEQAREIRNSTESGPVLAARYGVHRTLPSRIKRGLSWAETTRGASIFTMGAV